MNNKNLNATLRCVTRPSAAQEEKIHIDFSKVDIGPPKVNIKQIVKQKIPTGGITKTATCDGKVSMAKVSYILWIACLKISSIRALKSSGSTSVICSSQLSTVGIISR